VSGRRRDRHPHSQAYISISAFPFHLLLRLFLLSSSPPPLPTIFPAHLPSLRRLCLVFHLSPADSRSEDHAKATSEKIDNVFKAGYGTVLFFSDESVVNGWGNQMPMYAEAFKVWDAHASGMLHYNVWTALELEGHGANLQHLAEGSEPIQEGIRKVLGLPDSWCARRPGWRQAVRTHRGEGQGGHFRLGEW
jgi:hypothetical protein